MEPLRKALRLPRVNLFIADDTGLGKTIEAALIARELLLRRKAKVIVVAAPPSVLEQWKGELEERFGLIFELLDRAYMSRMRRERGFGVNPWRTHSRFLISHNLLIDLAYADPMREWLGPMLAGSLLILDEAHHAAPASGRRYGIETRFTRAVRDISSRFEHRLFLSATPHNGHSNSFSTLLELLDPYRFTRGIKIRGRCDLEQVMVRRLKEDIRQVQGGFPRRNVKRLVVDDLPPDAPELVLSRLLDGYRTAREERHATATKRAQAAAGLLVVGLQQRLLSSIEAFARSLKVHRETVLRHWRQAQALADPARSDAGRRMDDLYTQPPGSDDDRGEPTTSLRTRPPWRGRIGCGVGRVGEPWRDRQGAAAWLRTLGRVGGRTHLLDLVWSGPELPGVPARDTRRVYEELLGAASTSLWISSYVYSDGTQVFDQLARRMEAVPALKVTLLLNIERRQGIDRCRLVAGATDLAASSAAESLL